MEVCKNFLLWVYLSNSKIGQQAICVNARPYLLYDLKKPWPQPSFEKNLTGTGAKVVIISGVGVPVDPQGTYLASGSSKIAFKIS